MSKILLVAATPFEIAPVSKYFKIALSGSEGLFRGENNVSALVTGVGMVNTAYQLGRYSVEDFDCVINAGICGTFNSSISLGEVLQVATDTLAELGAENDTGFIRYSELNLGGTSVYFAKHNLQNSLLSGLKQVNGITVNKVHGNNESIKKTRALYDPDIESMEGAAFFRACEHFKGNCIQIRGVSNVVERRDKNKWNIPLAIENLNTFLISFIQTLVI